MKKTFVKDGGWGWIIVLASFATQFIAEGVTYTFGVFLVEISDKYVSAGKSRVSWIASIMIGTYHAVGPIGSTLVNRFGFLPVSVLGAALAAAGYAISYFIDGVIPLYFSIGVLAGIGLSLLYLPSMVSVAQWFDKRRALAIGISVSGSGLGTIFFEFITGLIIEKEGWRLTLLITAGMILCAIPFCLLFRPFIPSLELRTTVANKSNSTADKVPKDAADRNPILNWITSFLNFSLLKNPVFMLFGICDLLMGIGFNIPYLYLPEIEETYSDGKSSLLGIIGGLNVISRIFMGFLSDKVWLNRQLMYGIVLLMSGLVTIACPHLPTIMWLRGYAGFYGACIGGYMTLKSVILVDLFGLEQLTDAYGFLLLFQAFGFLIGPPIVGSLYDEFGSYTSGFYFAGTTLVVSGCLSFFIPILNKIISKRNLRKTSGSALDHVGELAGSDNQNFEHSETNSDVPNIVVS